MLGFDYNKFKAAIRVAEQKKHEELKEDVIKVKAFIEMLLTMMFENTAHAARTEYQGIDL